MRNITVTVSDKTYHEARVWAAKRDTSVSAVVQYLLTHLPGLPVANRGFPAPQTVSKAPETPSAEAVSAAKTALQA
jgi:hypothetical protein